MILECTDCKHCADFNGGYRVYCMHPDFPAEEVCNYFPVGEHDAEDCKGFEEGYPETWGWKMIDEYEKFSMEKYGEVTYQGVRDWIEQNTDRKKK